MKLQFNLKKLLTSALFLGASAGLMVKHMEDTRYPKVIFDGNRNRKHITITDYRQPIILSTEELLPGYTLTECYQDSDKDGSVDRYGMSKISSNAADSIKWGVTPQVQSDYQNYLNQIRKLQ
ncbi:MAG: hypothetical protein RL557_919 [archaeon]|jgi:hypothetical protein